MRKISVLVLAGIFPEKMSSPHFCGGGLVGVGLRLLIGVVEVLGALGLIGLGVTRILPTLAPLAAAGLMLIMGGASVFHAIRGESVSFTLVLLALLTLVAYTRWKVRPFVARQRAHRG